MKFVGSDFERSVYEYLLSIRPKYYQDSKVVNEITRVDADELEAYYTALDDVLNQFFVENATWGLEEWEQMLKIPTDLTKTDTDRRGQIKSKMRQYGTSTIAMIKNVAESYLNGEVEVQENLKNYLKNFNDSSWYQTFSDIANLSGKVAGSVVENPHIIKATNPAVLNSSILVPSSTNWNETTQQMYVSDSTLDGNLHTSDRKFGNGDISQHLFSFNLVAEIEKKIGTTIPGSTLADKITWLKSNISKLTCNWYGYGSTYLSNPTGTTDFTGKVSGSTTENANIAKRTDSNTVANTWASLITPTQGTEFIQSFYDPIKTQDTVNIISSTNTGSGNISQHLFSFNLFEYVKRKYGFTPPNVQWLKDNITTLTFNWYGKGIGPSGNKATIAILGYTSIWYTKGTTTAGTIQKVTYSQDMAASGASSFIQSDGMFHILAYADASNGTIASTITTDYIGLDVTIKNGNNTTVAAYYSNVYTSAYSSHTNGSVTKVPIGISGVSNVIQPDGFVHFVAYADPSNGVNTSSISTDYIELVIDFKGSFNGIKTVASDDDYNTTLKTVNNLNTFLNYDVSINNIKDFTASIDITEGLTTVYEYNGSTLVTTHDIPSSGYISFTINPSTTLLTFKCTTGLTKNGTVRFKNPMLERGLIKTNFEPSRSYQVGIKFIGKRGNPPNMNDIKDAIRQVTPAHLALTYILTYLVFNELEVKIFNNLETVIWDNFEKGSF